jgi:cobalamin biosynthesis protein CobT
VLIQFEAEAVTASRFSLPEESTATSNRDLTLCGEHGDPVLILEDLAQDAILFPAQPHSQTALAVG